MIRMHGRKLMGREHHDSPFVNLPSPGAVKAYNPQIGPCCTAESFQLDVLGMPRSAWNMSAADVFAQDFVKSHPTVTCSVPTIKEMWIVHTERLKQTCRGHLAAQEIANVKLQRNRRRERKTRVSL